MKTAFSLICAGVLATNAANLRGDGRSEAVTETSKDLLDGPVRKLPPIEYIDFEVPQFPRLPILIDAPHGMYPIESADDEPTKDPYDEPLEDLPQIENDIEPPRFPGHPIFVDGPIEAADDEPSKDQPDVPVKKLPPFVYDDIKPFKFPHLPILVDAPHGMYPIESADDDNLIIRQDPLSGVIPHFPKHIGPGPIYINKPIYDNYFAVLEESETIETPVDATESVVDDDNLIIMRDPPPRVMFHIPKKVGPGPVYINKPIHNNNFAVLEESETIETPVDAAEPVDDDNLLIIRDPSPNAIRRLRNLPNKFHPVFIH
jgi:hypothetical protein